MLKHEYICLNRDVCFLKEGKPILLPTGTELCSVYNDTGKKEEKLLYYIENEPDIFYESNDPEVPCSISKNCVVIKDALFTVVNRLNKSRQFTYISNGTFLIYISDYEGVPAFECPPEYNKNGDSFMFMIPEDINDIQKIVSYPESNSIKITASSEDGGKVKKFVLDETKIYAGQEGIDCALLFMQTSDLSKRIIRDDSNTLFVDLGPVEMWPDYDKADWIMKLNANIPIASAVSVGKRICKGKARLAVVLHDNFI